MSNVATLLSRRKVLQVSTETAKGTLKAGTTHVLVYDPVMQPVDDTQTRQPSGKALGNFPSMPGARAGTCNFKAEMRGDGSGGWDTGIEKCLQACGFSQASEVITPVSAVTTMKTITIGMHEDGLYKQLHGCMGNVKFTGEFGKQLFLEFTFSGVWNAPTDVALPTATISTEKPMRLRSVIWTIDGRYMPYVSTFSLDMGNSVSPIEDISKAQGILNYVITGRDPVITLDALAELVAEYDAFGKWLAGTEAALSMVFSSDGIDLLTLAVPKLQHRAPQEGDRDGKLTHEYTAQLNVSDHDTGDDELSLTVSSGSSASSSPSSTPSVSPSSTPSSSPSAS